ncbi:Snd1p Ecym_4177 [Eremothecium cymbalariae DBVPG|uniref:Uncharacterized protein n=1 Tax=Eremothecium cymbalariae (strain CBS 270.75 / DBVPG 7215 / KCTC 17166 / NRRL Y-17582) TaxID=931890 RepID=G8JTA0_ERECY|nr:hypothetical protein Ecym_4177 [Eremothecium cymbalariae DBVPG\
MAPVLPAVSSQSKVKVKALGRLFLLSYFDPVPEDVGEIDEFKVYLYIDIPTIDYYDDEMTHGKISRMNRKFKIHKVREGILSSFMGYNDTIWTRLKHASMSKRINFSLCVCSGGSLRYVESIKYFIESCWSELYDYRTQIQIKFHVQTTPTSQKWFNTFLDKDILASNAVEFTLIESYSVLTKTSIPFKQYYTKLSDKFTNPQNPAELTSIIVVTNNTGVRALLTILSDRPLTRYLHQQSLDALKNNAVRHKSKLFADSIIKLTDSSEDETSLSRTSSQLLYSQNSFISTEKFQTRKRPSSLNKRRLSDKIALTVEHDSVNTSSTMTSSSSLDGLAADAKNSSDHFRVLGKGNGYEDDDDANGDGDGECDDDDDDDDDENNNDCSDDDDDEFEDDDEQELGSSSDEDGISFYAPSKLSRSATNDNFIFISSANNNNKEMSSGRRFRSLSLMDPPSRAPFAAQHGPSVMGDEICSSTTNNEWYTNIYVHDGHFVEPLVTPQRKRSKKSLKNVCSSNGLIPPIFYSKLSSPSSSVSSSDSSLHDLKLLPGTFSKLLNIGIPEPNSGADPTSNSSNTLFQKNLIHKSFEEVRKQPSIQLFQTLVGPNRFALNFQSNKPIIAESTSITDQSDSLTSGATDDSEASNTIHMSHQGSAGTLLSGDKVNQTLNKYNLQIYDISRDATIQESGDKNSTVGDQMQSMSPDTTTGHNYKKPKFTLDLYDDDNLTNGAWVLGANNR